ncbi:hypothetical protein PMZ80_007214 [Knufia obscura]|uniref:Uncharacterized protein n=2 Tax=Knufia TaxID=430999 RepID=A0AAN8I5M7_9EURO|nr:hypothetical protein PMZ80_007214 [Knufia obscura]KAK5953224.1 hypothetical protein OHC33_005792 [Knufia fluminis]
MGVQTRNGSEAEVTTAAPAQTTNNDNDIGPRRPDLSRIQTDPIGPETSTHPSTRRESDQLIYSGSTHSAKSTKSSSSSTKPSSQTQLPHPPKQRATSIPGLVITKSMSKFSLLPPNEEDDLHARRLLNIEEKPFKRIQKRLLAPSNPIHEYLRRIPVDGSLNTSATGNGETVSDEETTTTPTQPKPQEEISLYKKQLENFSNQTHHDFSALTTSLARLQFLLTSNEKERSRYTEQVSSITSQHGAIRNNTSELRSRLTEAREQLAKRKGYDMLAEGVLWVDGRVGGERAKTREELRRESEKLRGEIEELEREGSELKGQWVDRREALGAVIGEAGRLRRVVRGEPEVVEEDDRKEDEDGSSVIDGEEETKRRDDEDENQEQDDGMLGAGDRDREASNAGTPRPMDDGGATPLPERESGGMTPLPTTQESGARTPRSMAGDDAGGFTPRPTTAEGGSALKNEMTTGDDDVDMSNIAEQQGLDVPEAKVDDAEKAEVDEMEG